MLYFILSSTKRQQGQNCVAIFCGKVGEMMISHRKHKSSKMVSCKNNSLRTSRRQNASWFCFSVFNRMLCHITAAANRVYAKRKNISNTRRKSQGWLQKTSKRKYNNFGIFMFGIQCKTRKMFSKYLPAERRSCT